MHGWFCLALPFVFGLARLPRPARFTNGKRSALRKPKDGQCSEIGSCPDCSGLPMKACSPCHSHCSNGDGPELKSC